MNSERNKRILWVIHNKDACVFVIIRAYRLKVSVTFHERLPLFSEVTKLNCPVYPILTQRGTSTKKTFLFQLCPQVPWFRTGTLLPEQRSSKQSLGCSLHAAVSGSDLLCSQATVHCFCRPEPEHPVKRRVTTGKLRLPTRAVLSEDVRSSAVGYRDLPAPWLLFCLLLDLEATIALLNLLLLDSTEFLSPHLSS